MSRTVKSAERTMLLLEYFAQRQEPATVGEIAESLDIPQPSTSMLVKTMVDLGYLTADPLTRSYLPSMRVPILGTWLRRRFPVTGNLPKLVQKLSEETGESTVLSMRNGIYAQYLLAQEASSPLRLHVQSGFMRPLACSASGWALLMSETDRNIELIARRTMTEVNVQLWRNSAKDALKNVHVTRQSGFAFSHGETTAKQCSIAMPLPDLEGSPPLAIAVGGPLIRIERKAEALVIKLKEFINAIEQKDMAQLLEANLNPE